MESRGKAGVSSMLRRQTERALIVCGAPVGECILNRRIPNGTYGGVGGRGLTAPSYPISVASPESARMCLNPLSLFCTGAVP